MTISNLEVNGNRYRWPESPLVVVCIDGGVTNDNFVDVAHLGADLVVTGSAAFAGGNVAENLERMFGILGDSVGR